MIAGALSLVRGAYFSIKVGWTSAVPTAGADEQQTCSNNPRPASAVGRSGMPVKGRTATGAFGGVAAGGLLKVMPRTAVGAAAQDGRAALATSVHDVVVPAGNENPASATAVTVVVEPYATLWLPAATETALAR